MSIIVLAFIIILIVAIFSIQNSTPVALSFLFWKFEASLAVVIFLSALTGVIIGAIIVFVIRIKRARKEQKTSS
ncbi:MAG: lipopolysaccharide assembly protein LapA domain-containing protein [Proteobacteria bacterium]|nr:lipopolysaccharide assembly protein LapA domain-containing protein [Pseudomonadota bacterium]